jgi:endonuclease YncB( thermonuclease family)
VKEASMGKEMVLSESRYSKLVNDLRKLIDKGRTLAQRAANFELLKGYWSVGERLAEERLAETAGYGQSIMEKLALELKTDRSTLVRCLQFHRDFPKGPPVGTRLSWSHFRILVTIKDDKARSFYEKAAEEKEWTHEELSRAVQADYHGEVQTPGGPAKPVKKLHRPDGGPFIYRAEVMRVLDGDTLLARLDLGFDVWKKERIRFAGVDAPALDEDGGDEAFEYVRDQLGKAKVVVIYTNKAEAHGRYVGHVFYSTDERDTWEKVFRQGRYLSQELLDKGLARVY